MVFLLVKNFEDFIKYNGGYNNNKSNNIIVILKKIKIYPQFVDLKKKYEYICT